MRSAVRQRRGFPYKRRWAGTFAGGDVNPVTFPAVFLKTRVYIALGADLTASYLTWNWLDITDRVRHDLGITVTAGRGDYRGRVNTSRCTIKLSNRDGYLCRRNPFSPYWGLLTKNTPIWIQVDPGSGFVDRYFGYVNEWPTSWADASGNDSFVTIQCSGVMRRLEKGRVLRSPVYRSVAGRTQNALQPIAYWPMEDGSSSTQFASAVAGIAAVSPVGDVSFAADSELVGSDPLPTFGDGASATFSVPIYTLTDAWMVQMVINVPEDPLVDTVLARIETGREGAIARYDVVVSPSPLPSALGVYAYDSSGVLQAQSLIFLDGSGPANPDPADFYGTPWSFRVCEQKQSAGVLGIIVFLSAVDGSYTNGSTGIVSGTSTVRTVTPMANSATAGLTIGHVAVHADNALSAGGALTSDVVASVGSLSGWDGEQAHERIERLCREEGVPVVALAGRSAAMGPQGSGTLLAELRACETADQGLLYEHQFGVAYRALSERYNQPVVLSLDFDAGHHAGIPEPRDDDSRLVNKFTASRRNGSSATAEITSGTLGTGPGGSGFYDLPGTISVETDAQLAGYAAWQVFLGTVDEDRWPALPFQLHRNPSLIQSWLATPIGARINFANPPSQMNPATIDAILEGYTERWVQEAWDVTLATSPATPYQVGAYGTSTLNSLWDTESSSLASGVDADDTTLSVATQAGHTLWVTGSSPTAPFPFDIKIAGVRLTVTAISGTSSPQTFTVQRSVDGQDKALGAGELVSLWTPARYAL